MPCLEMRDISRYYSVNNTLALDNMNFSVEEGEIHALAGENGAGKTTLMKILFDIEKPDSGKVIKRGKTGMVFQHFRLVYDFSVLENIIIGSEPVKMGFALDKNKARMELKKLFQKFGFSLDLNTKVKNLSTGQKQLVEIVKVIYNNADILIFDEPTALLTLREAEKLRETLLFLKRSGKTIILISHKIQDILSVSDRFTIIRKGRFIKTVNTCEVTASEISALMSGTHINETLIDTTHCMEEKLFSFRDEQVSFSLKKGEIIGITANNGNGLMELEKSLFSFQKPGMTLGKIPSDRIGRGVDVQASLKENLIARNRRDFTRWGFLLQGKIRDFARSLIHKYRITGTPECVTGTLSGGNIQKAVIARELSLNPHCLILSEPTWGIDLESTDFIYSEIKKLKEKGISIILLTSDTDEALKLSNRIIVLYRGRAVKEINNNGTVSADLIGRYASGTI